MNKNNTRIRIKDIALQAGVSVGTVDRVLHGRSGISESSRKKVEAMLQQLDYQPNMYASALASNKKYLFVCLIPSHLPDEYWDDVEAGCTQCVKEYSDFNISLSIRYYDQYEQGAFLTASEQLLADHPDGVILTPVLRSETEQIVSRLKAQGVPYVFIDSNIPELEPLAFYGQHAHQSGYFAARMMSLMMGTAKELVVFRQIYEGKLGSNQQMKREQGFYAYMQEHHPDFILRELNFNAKEPTQSEAAIDRFFQEHPDVHFGITFNSKAYIVGEYMLQHQRTDFHLMGYDLLKRNIRCLRERAIDFIIAQQPTQQGYSCVESLCNHLILKKDIQPCNYMPIALLSIENIEFYLNIHKKEYLQLIV